MSRGKKILQDVDYGGGVYSGRLVRHIGNPEVEEGEHSCDIRYKFVGVNFESFKQGVTDLGANKDIDSSYLKCEDNFEAWKYFDALRKCTEGSSKVVRPLVVRPFFVHKDLLVVERVELSFVGWLEKEYRDFKGRNEGKSGGVLAEEATKRGVVELEFDSEELRNWFEHIKPRFRAIFRDLMDGLRQIHSSKHVSKDLITDNSIIIGADGTCKAKLTLLRHTGDVDLDISIWRNINQLRDMLVGAISFPFHQSFGITKAQETKLLKMTFVPCDLASFIRLLDTPSARKIDIQWLLDESFFWTSEEKILFIRKLFDLIVVMKKYWARVQSEDYIKEKLDEMNFVLLASKDPRAVEVFIGRTLVESEAEKSIGRDCFDFKQIVVYFRNMDVHYNDYPTELEQASTVIYPQNPNKSICVDYVICGVCKHKHECWLHHPTDLKPEQRQRVLEINFPQQPEKAICYAFMDNGDCTYRKICRFHHPLRQLARRRNAPKKLRLDKCRVTEKADALFGSACSLLRRAMEAAWIDGISNGIEFKDMLDSQVPF